MATIRELLVKINGDNSGLGNALRGAGQDLQAMQDQAKKTSAVFDKLGKDLTLKVTAPIVAMGTAMVMAASESEKATARLANAIDAVGLRGKVSVTSISAYANELQKLTVYDDEATIGAAEMLVSLTALDEQGLKKLIPRVQDLATKFKMDLNQAATLVGKTIGSNVNALSRYGIEVDSSASKSEKLAQVLEGLAKFQGAAEAEGQTFAGQLMILKNEAENLAEEFGAILLPVISKLIAAIREIVAKFSSLSTGQKEAILKAAALAAALGPVLLVLGRVTSAISSMGTILAAAAGPGGWIMLAVGAFALLAVSIGKSIKEANDFGKVMSGTSEESPQKQLQILEARMKQYTEEQERFKKKVGGGLFEKVQQPTFKTTPQDLAVMAEYGGVTGFKQETERMEKNIRLTQERIDVIKAEIKAEEDAAAKRQEEALALFNLSNGTAAATEETEELNYQLEDGIETNHGYSITLQKLVDDVQPLEKAEEKAAKAALKLKETLLTLTSSASRLIGPLVELGTTLGFDASMMETFGGIAEDAINGITAALTGDWIGVAVAALGVVDKIIKSFQRGRDAAREAQRSTESYMETVVSSEAKLKRLLTTYRELEEYSTIDAGGKKLAVEKQALEDLTVFKEVAASYGDDIGQTLGDAIVNGMSKVDFMAKIGEILINAMIAAALATGPIASAMAAIGEKIAYMVVNGFTEEGIAEVEAMASNLYDLFSGEILPIVQRIQGIFGTGGGGEETGSFASGVTNWKGGVARVGEQGPETVRLPRGASVEPNGMRSGGITMTFNSPRALSPMETKRAMLAAGRQLAFETGGNF